MNDDILKAFENMLAAEPASIQFNQVGSEALVITGKVSTHILKLRITRIQPRVIELFVDQHTHKTRFEFDCYVDDAMAFGNYEFGEAAMPEIKKQIALVNLRAHTFKRFDRQDAYNFLTREDISQ